MYYAYKYLLHRKYIVCTLGITFFVLSFLLTSLNMYDSTNKYYMDNLNFDKNVNIELTYKGTSEDINTIYAGLEKYFSTMGIDQSKVYYYETVDIDIPNLNDSVTLVGLTKLQIASFFNEGKISQEIYDAFDQENSVIISENVVDQLKAQIGDKFDFNVKNSLATLPNNLQLDVEGIVNLDNNKNNFYTSINTIKKISQETGVEASKKVSFSIPTTTNFIKMVEKKLNDPNFLQIFSFKVQNPLFNEVIEPLYIKYLSYVKVTIEISVILAVVLIVMFYLETKQRINEIKLVYLATFSLKGFLKALVISTTIISIFFMIFGSITSFAYNYHKLNNFAMKSRDLGVDNFDLSIFDSIKDNVLNLDIHFDYYEMLLTSIIVILVANILRIIVAKYILGRITLDV